MHICFILWVTYKVVCCGYCRFKLSFNHWELFQVGSWVPLTCLILYLFLVLPYFLVLQAVPSSSKQLIEMAKHTVFFVVSFPHLRNNGFSLWFLFPHLSVNCIFPPLSTMWVSGSQLNDSLITFYSLLSRKVKPLRHVNGLDYR